MTDKEKIQQLIGKARLREALALLVEYEQDAMLLLSSLSKLERDSMLGLISTQEESLSRAKITYSALSMVQSITTETVSDDTEFVINPTKKPLLFISYASSDISYKNELEMFLKPLSRQGLFDIWSDTAILPGEDWDTSIKKHLQEADIILLLVSASYLATDYTWEVQMKIALERHAQEGLIVIPIILRPCNFLPPLANLLPLPTGGKPISQWIDRDLAYFNIVESLKKAIHSYFPQTV